MAGDLSIIGTQFYIILMKHLLTFLLFLLILKLNETELCISYITRLLSK